VNKIQEGENSMTRLCRCHTCTCTLWLAS